MSGDRQICPYLDTIDRTVLDFDFEKQCSVTLSDLNVYCCLVCGKFFQGKSPKSPAFFHALDECHYVFINLQNTKVYCLPDNYEVIDSSLADIKYALDPSYTAETIKELDTKQASIRTLDGLEYVPGIVGLNDIKGNTSINVVLQALMRVPRFRNFFLVPANYESAHSLLLDSFGRLVRRVWSRGLFKAQISPHEMLQAVSYDSKKRFRAGQTSEPGDFLSWLLNTMDRKLRAAGLESIVRTCFRGEVEVTTYTKAKGAKEEVEEKVAHGAGGEDAMQDVEDADELIEGYLPPVKVKGPFFLLSLVVPAPPLFTSEAEKDIIPQVPLYQLLSKFDGLTQHHVTKTGQKKKYVITRPPRYLILQIKRFTKNQYFVEKNRTIVNFPLQDLDIADYCKLPKGSKVSTRYNLLANIRHQDEKEEELNKTLTKMDGDKITGTYSVHILNKVDNKWFEMQDLIVTAPLPQAIALSEAYLQVYERVK